MTKQTKKQKFSSGFTLIEAVVFLFIFSVVTLSFYRAWSAATSAILDSKRKAGAIALANERMEQIRNMSYDEIGTAGGEVEGDIPPSQTIERSGMQYIVETDVDIVNDNFDNDPEDSNPADYKKVSVRAFWEEGNEARSAFLLSSFVPPGIEDVFTGGILKLKVIDNSGNSVPLVWVRIKNSSISPALDTYEKTNTEGEIWLYESNPSLETYEITVSPDGKDDYGYYQVKTFMRTATFEPDDVHGSVIGGVINSKTIETDKVSDINLHLRDPLGNVVQNETFDFMGGREKGYDSSVPGEIYYFSETNLDSGSDGLLNFSDMSSGSYFFDYPADDPDYKFLWMDPSVDTENKFDLAPNVTLDATAVMADKDIASILVKVTDQSDGTSIEGANVEVTDGALINISVETNKYGYAYFPDAGVLPAGTYTVTAEKDGSSDDETVEITSSLDEVNLEL